MLSADPVPPTAGGPRAGEAYTVGTLQALIERANEEVFYGPGRSPRSAVPPRG